MAKLRYSIVLCVVLGSARAALATTGTGSGVCQPAYGETPEGYFSMFGLTNTSSNDEVFWCPVVVGTTSGNSISVSSGWFNFYDGSTTDNFWCIPSLVYTSGSQWFGREKYTCSTGGGCNDTSGVSATGYNWLGWGGADLPQGGTFTLYDNNYFGYYCMLPKASPSDSWIFAYGVN